MSKTGMSRKIDKLGRVVLPKEMRKNLGMEVGDYIDFNFTDTGIFISKTRQYCVFCNSTENVLDILSQKICSKCLSKIKRLG